MLLNAMVSYLNSMDNTPLEGVGTNIAHGRKRLVFCLTAKFKKKLLPSP